MNDKLMRLAKCSSVAPPATLPESCVQHAATVQALRLAKLRSGASAADIASWCQVHQRTVERWLAGSPPDLDALVISRRFYPVFLDCLDEVTGRKAA